MNPHFGSLLVGFVVGVGWMFLMAYLLYDREQQTLDDLQYQIDLERKTKLLEQLKHGR